MKFYPLALLAMLVAAATAHAGDHYNYNNSLADCGCQAHSWKTGCCDREPSCCDHIWDGYCSNHGCCGLHLPQINWNSLHTNAAPYQVPCLRLPELHLPKPCFSHSCAGSCTAAPACNQGCTAVCVPACPCGTPVLDWMKSKWHKINAPLDCGCGMPCGCDSGCAGSNVHSQGGVNYGAEEGTMIYETAPRNQVPNQAVPADDAPMPPAPQQESRDMNKNEKKKSEKKDKKDNKTANNWLFPSLSL